MSGFVEFIEERRAAASAYCRGDPGPVDALSTDRDPATFFGPGGGITEGASAVRQVNRDGAGHFGANGQTSLEILQMAADGDVGYWAGIQHAQVEFDGKPVIMKLRVTELFRCQGGTWKLVHRHADMAEQDQG